MAFLLGFTLALLYEYKHGSRMATSVTWVQLEITDSSGTRRLYAPGEVLKLEIDGGTSAAPSLIVNAIRDHLGLDVAFLRSPADGVAEVECLDESSALPRGLRWRTHEEGVTGARAPWEKPGWLREILEILDVALAQVGVSRIGPPTPVRHWNLSSVFRIATDQFPAWLKAVPPLFGHEGRVIKWVAGIAPGAVPRLISMGEGWMATADAGSDGGIAGRHPLSVLASIQLSSIGRTPELLALGCPDRRLGRLMADADALAGRRDLLGAADAASLHASLRQLEMLCTRVAKLGIPATLVHGDIHDENVCLTSHGWVLLDWTDACVAHPFVDLARPLMDATAAERSAVESIYGSAWQGLFPASEIDFSVRAARVLGAAHQAETFRRMIDEIGGGYGHAEQLRIWVRGVVAALNEDVKV